MYYVLLWYGRVCEKNQSDCEFEFALNFTVAVFAHHVTRDDGKARCYGRTVGFSLPIQYMTD